MWRACCSAHARSCAERNLTDASAVRAQGLIDLDTLQRFVNFHYSVTLDLFGSEISSNAASYYTGALKGRYAEAERRRRSRVVR